MWLDIAKKLRIGSSIRVPCCIGCAESTSKNMIISSDYNRYSGYCFKCGSRVTSKRGDLTLKELHLIRTQEKIWKTYCSLPRDFTFDIPIEGRVWLAGAGLHEDIYRKYMIGYSPGMHRVILPIYKASVLAGIQARSINADVKPKYLSNFNYKNCFFTSSKYGQDKKVLVIVEDILSAIKIGEQFTSCAILGTQIHSNILTFASFFDNVVLWFDGDSAGKRCTEQAKKRLQAIGHRSTSISTELDPKKYSYDRIREVVLSALT